MSKSDLEDLQAQIATFRTIIEKVEWLANENGDECCPWCGALSPSEFAASNAEYRERYKAASNGHNPSCPRQAILEITRPER
jgi:hypothetical protein